jgi:ABC-type antimicrobial peptide transport system permease subunit
VAGDVHQFWFEKQPPLMVYLPYRQVPRASMYLALRTHADPAAALPAARERIRRLDASLPLHEPKPMPEVMLESMSAMRLSAGMMTVFGILALLLAAVGVYGVMAYAVTQRHREFGIRIALGARPHEVLRMVVWQGFLLTAWGIAAGLAGGFAMSRAMSGIMFGVSAGSLAVLAGAPALLAMVSLAACWIPARAVTRVDPVEALKAE